MKRICFFLCCLCYFVLPTYAQPNHYIDSMQDWKQRRLDALKAPDGWVNLAGLFWLEEGRTSFGSGTNAQLRFPAGTLPAVAGYFERNGNQVVQVLENEAQVLVNQQTKRSAIVYDSTKENQPVIEAGSLRWTLIKREDRIGIRVRDLEHPAIKALTIIPAFPIDPSFRIVARLVRPLIPSVIAITNVLGQTTAQTSPGKLFFTISGKEYQLDALQEEDKLFIVFGDATSDKGTYPAGRFMYADMPGVDGFTILDFNKAFNPPCAFTPFATCPLPPKQNILDLPIVAGEKYPLH